MIYRLVIHQSPQSDFELYFRYYFPALYSNLSSLIYVFIWVWLLPNDLFKPESQICGFNISTSQPPPSWLANNSAFSLPLSVSLKRRFHEFRVSCALREENIYEWNRTTRIWGRTLCNWCDASTTLWQNLLSGKVKVSSSKVRLNWDRKRMRFVDKSATWIRMIV